MYVNRIKNICIYLYSINFLLYKNVLPETIESKLVH